MASTRHKVRRPALNGIEKILTEFVENISAVAIHMSQMLQQRRDEFEWFRSHSELITKHDLEEMEKRIMSKISDFAEKQKAFHERQSAAIDGLTASVEGVTGDVKALNEQIAALQNSPGAMTPEDEALLDGIQAASEGLTAKLEGVGAALTALDALNPPRTPPA